MKAQNEFKQLQQAINNWAKANKGHVTFIGSFVSYDPKKIKEDADDITKDTLVVAFGYKNTLGIHLESLNEELSKEKEGLINW